MASRSFCKDLRAVVDFTICRHLPLSRLLSYLLCFSDILFFMRKYPSRLSSKDLKTRRDLTCLWGISKVYSGLKPEVGNNFIIGPLLRMHWQQVWHRQAIKMSNCLSSLYGGVEIQVDGMAQVSNAKLYVSSTIVAWTWTFSSTVCIGNRWKSHWRSLNPEDIDWAFTEICTVGKVCSDSMWKTLRDEAGGYWE